MAKFIVEIKETQPLTKKEKKELALAMQEVLKDVSECTGFCESGSPVNDKIGMEVQVTVGD